MIGMTSFLFFISCMDYLGFKYVGKNGKNNYLIDESLVNGVRVMLIRNLVGSLLIELFG